MEEENKSYHFIDTTIDSISQQIELLSNKCKLESNKKSNNLESILEASSLMLQLSRSLNELLVTKKFLEDSSKGNPNDLFNFIINGRKS